MRVHNKEILQALFSWKFAFPFIISVVYDIQIEILYILGRTLFYLKKLGVVPMMNSNTYTGCHNSAYLLPISIILIVPEKV